ncbi:hypothetical protein [Microbacterium sp.]|uniref:hypothetical protein n=1 Tax=Microbacterium sp. TaxID=51671 RepID=UPI0039E2192D
MTNRRPAFTILLVTLLGAPLLAGCTAADPVEASCEQFKDLLGDFAVEMTAASEDAAHGDLAGVLEVADRIEGLEGLPEFTAYAAEIRVFVDRLNEARTTGRDTGDAVEQLDQAMAATVAACVEADLER